MAEAAAHWYVDECAVEARAAKLLGDRLIALKIIPYVMPALARPQVGDLYLARITKSARGMNAIFVDLGEGGEGLLRTRGTLSEGELVAARVIQSAYGSKRPVLKPEETTDEVSAGQAGGRVRRISEPMSAERYLATHWRRDGPVVVDSDRAWRGPAVQSAKPGLFEREGIEAQIEAALEFVVSLPSGGRLIIEQTEALTAIDVDAGSSTRVSEVNTEAAAEIPYQIAVRGLAGNIIIDFAQIGSASVLAPLKERIASGATEIGIEVKIGVAGRTGLLELQRKRTEAPLASLLTVAGLTHGAVPMRLNLEAQAARLAHAIRAASAHMPGALDLRVGAALADWLTQGEGRASWQAILGASPVPLHLLAGGLDDAISVERRGRSAQ